MLLKGKTRQRSVHTKSRHGCGHCRQRRVKCDQQKPVCGGCKKFGYECAYKQLVAKTSIASLGRDELRTIQFYREHTSNDLSGYFDGDFWTRDILRLSYGNQTLQRFVLSLSSLDETFRLRARPENADVAVSRYAFSLRQYQDAIHGLMLQMKQTSDLAIILASCLVCICIELWHGDNLMARRHALAGLKIAQSHGLPQSADAHGSESNLLISKQLLPTLWRHCAQMGIKVNKGGRPFPGSNHLKCDEPILKPKSTTFDDARIQMSRLIDLVAAEVARQKPDQDLTHLARHLQYKFDEWYDQVKKLFKFKACQSTKPDREECLLRILYFETTAQLAALVTKNDNCYDDQTNAFRTIVTYCNQVLEYDDGLKFSSGTRRASDGVTVTALLLAAWKCSDPQIRRDALRLLYRSRRLEGLWSSSMIGVMAEGIMLIEEERRREFSLQGHSQPPQRIVVTGVDYDPGILEEHQHDWTPWREDPPALSITYTDPNECSVTSQRMRVPLKPYPGAAGFGMKSVFWWPIEDRFAIMNEVVPEETKALDGPHLGFVPFKGTVNQDVQNVLSMRWFTLNIPDA